VAKVGESGEKAKDEGNLLGLHPDFSAKKESSAANNNNWPNIAPRNPDKISFFPVYSLCGTPFGKPS
jgi:hypothetical protein